MSLNKAILMGRLTKDPVKRYTPAEIPVTNFCIAVDRDGKDKGVDYIDIVCWRGTADFAEKYFHKGEMVIIVGRIQMSKYTDRNGIDRVKAEVVADNLYFGQAKGNTSIVPKDISAGDWEELDDSETLPF